MKETKSAVHAALIFFCIAVCTLWFESLFALNAKPKNDTGGQTGQTKTLVENVARNNESKLDGIDTLILVHKIDNEYESHPNWIVPKPTWIERTRRREPKSFEIHWKEAKFCARGEALKLLKRLIQNQAYFPIKNPLSKLQTTYDGQRAAVFAGYCDSFLVTNEDWKSAYSGLGDFLVLYMFTESDYQNAIAEIDGKENKKYGIARKENQTIDQKQPSHELPTEANAATPTEKPPLEQKLAEKLSCDDRRNSAWLGHQAERVQIKLAGVDPRLRDQAYTRTVLALLKANLDPQEFTKVKTADSIYEIAGYANLGGIAPNKDPISFITEAIQNGVLMCGDSSFHITFHMSIKKAKPSLGSPKHYSMSDFNLWWIKNPTVVNDNNYSVAGKISDCQLTPKKLKIEQYELAQKLNTGVQAKTGYAIGGDQIRRVTNSWSFPAESEDYQIWNWVHNSAISHFEITQDAESGLWLGSTPLALINWEVLLGIPPKCEAVATVFGERLVAPSNNKAKVTPSKAELAKQVIDIVDATIGDQLLICDQGERIIISAPLQMGSNSWGYDFVEYLNPSFSYAGSDKKIKFSDFDISGMPFWAVFDKSLSPYAFWKVGDKQEWIDCNITSNKFVNICYTKTKVHESEAMNGVQVKIIPVTSFGSGGKGFFFEAARGIQHVESTQFKPETDEWTSSKQHAYTTTLGIKNGLAVAKWSCSHDCAESAVRAQKHKWPVKVPKSCDYFAENFPR